MARPQIAVSIVALVAAAALAAGCVGAPGKPTTAAATTSLDAAANATAAPGATLYFTLDGKLAPAAPASESTVPLTTPFNSPFTGGYPSWKGPLPAPLAKVSRATLHLFVTSSSANLEAGVLPIFGGLPAMDVRLSIENATASGPIRGPTLVRAGEIVELVGNVTFPKPVAPASAGLEVSYKAVVYYLHAKGAAEFRYVVGGTGHASRMELA
jgi:hypothetical protein